MLDTLEVLPPDPTVARFRRDPSPERVDLSIGVFRDAHGHTPVLRAIHSAARAAIAEEDSKAYMGATGCERFNEAVTRLVLGPSHPALHAGRTATLQTTGASTALRLAADLIHTASPAAALALPDPTWSNHRHVFASAGLKVTAFPYYDAAASRLTWVAAALITVTH